MRSSDAGWTKRSVVTRMRDDQTHQIDEWQFQRPDRNRAWLLQGRGANAAHGWTWKLDEDELGHDTGYSRSHPERLDGHDLRRTVRRTLQRFPLEWDHLVIPFERETP